MTDVVTAEKRSEMMSGIKSKDTRPELLVRQGLHRRGLRFRLHKKDLPGNPDIYSRRHKTAIFVNGCFWHMHDCKFGVIPKSNSEFWSEKLRTNQARDRKNQFELLDQGKRVAIVWECALKGRQPKEIETMLDGIFDWITSENSSFAEFIRISG